MIIAVASGKGGTGKTMVAVSLALACEQNVQILDSDVEEPNVHIFIKPEINQVEDVVVKIPEIDIAKCNFCGKCSQVCAFNAIAITPGTVSIFSELCHSCGACSYFCPTGAITEINKTIGKISLGYKGELKTIEGRLNVGEVMPTPVIKAAHHYFSNEKDTIIDAPPGASCAMVHSVAIADYCILVTEPTPFGLNDLKIAVAVLKKLKIPFGVIINRCNIGDQDVEQYCLTQEIKILLQIPYSRQIAGGTAIGQTLIDIIPKYRSVFRRLFEIINNEYGTTNLSN